MGAGGSGADDIRPTQVISGAPVGDRIGVASSPSQPGSERYIVSARSRADLEHAVQQLAAIGARPTNEWHDSMFGVVVELDDSAARHMMRVRGVLSVEPDRPLHRTESQVSPPWGLDRIDQRTGPLDGAYHYAASGVGVTAYVIDTGLWLSHEEFAGRVLDGAFWDFGDGTGTWDCNGHGTHVAGTLGGSTYGVAKSVSVVPVKVLDCSGSGTTSGVIAGIDWVITHHATGVPAVANLSLGGDASPSIDAAVEALIADGVTVVVAAGNDADATCNYSPARVPAALTVAASTSNDQRASYSNYGSCNDIFAPGSKTLSAYAGSDTETAVLSGTSMASPHVAGAAALLLESDPAVTPATIAAELDTRSTKDVLTTLAGDPNKLLYVSEDAVSEDVVLTVTKDGSGTGTAFSSPAAIDCGSTCAASFPAATIVSLFADPATGSVFTGWSGGGCSGTSSCAVTMDASTAVTATFVLESHELTVSTAGSGLGVVSSPSMVSCATTCVTTHTHGSLVTLAATPNAGSIFTGWSGGGCGGMSSCEVMMDASTAVAATFAGSFGALEPARVLDSRVGGLTVDGGFAGVGVRGAGSVTELLVVGRGGVPVDAGAVVLNVTVTEPEVAGFVSVFPCGGVQPNASSVNYVAGQTVANAVVAKVGVAGKVCVYTLGTAHLIVDVNGSM
ncbi:MAG TPA: S8 family peptidase [Ilumatobacter sp.]|nr:S8 family peptidase [Ilumatobacter sp.]